MVKFTALVAALVVAAVGSLTIHLPSFSNVKPAGAFHPGPPSRFVASENADRWQQLAEKQQADEDAAKAAADAQAAEQARQAELARQQAAAAAVARPAPAPAPPPAPGSVQDIIVRACSPYGQATVDWCLRVASCESGYNPNAYNPAGPYYGLFQFLMSTFKNTPYGNQNIYDPYYNAAAAAWKYSVSGGGAWGCK